MRNKVKRILSLGAVLIVLFFQICIYNNDVYAITNNKTVQEQNKDSHKKSKQENVKKEEPLTKQKIGIGAGIILVVLIIGRAITPKEAFK